MPRGIKWSVLIFYFTNNQIRILRHKKPRNRVFFFLIYRRDRRVVIFLRVRYESENVQIQGKLSRPKTDIVKWTA